MEPKICKYCNVTKLTSYDEEANKYKEADGTLHTRERCEAIRNQKGHEAAVAKTTTQGPNMQKIEDKLNQLIQAVDALDKKVDGFFKAWTSHNSYQTAAGKLVEPSQEPKKHTEDQDGRNDN